MISQSENLNWDSSDEYMTKANEDRIIREHESRIQIVALSFSRYGVPLADLAQEGRIALLLAARNWKPEFGASIWTYARHAVHGAMFAAVGRSMKAPSNPLQEAEDRPAEGTLTAEDATLLFELLSLLTPKQRHVLVQHLYLGRTIEDLVRETGASIGGIWNICNDAVLQIRAAMEAA
jgi:RNA polymerase sigma factor (sigma-70 family)